MCKSRTATDCLPCVRCGYCCKKGACSYGEEDKHGRCWFLVKDDTDIGTYKCAIRDQIIEKEADSSIPMFDYYCSCSVLNDVRNEVVRKMENLKRDMSIEIAINMAKENKDLTWFEIIKKWFSKGDDNGNG